MFKGLTFDAIGWQRCGVGSLALALLGSALLSAGCSDSSGGPQAAAASGTPAVSQEQEATTEESEDAIAIRIREVVREPLSAVYSTSTTLRADKQATVTARTAGVLEQLLREEGDWVEAGETLAILEDDAQAIEYQRASATRDNKVREYERAKNLHEQGLTSDEEFDTARREADEATHSAALLELMLSRTRIRATFAGKIVKRHLDVGGIVGDGTAVYDLADLDPLYADVNVPERQLVRLAPGQIVRLFADGSGRTTDAVVERIAPMVDPESGTVKVTLAVRESEGMRPGSFVRVEIVTDTHTEALVVPRSALVAEGRRWHIFRVDDGGGKVKRLEVSRGFEEGDSVEILEAIDADPPLGAGDRIVVVGVRALTDGSIVEIFADEAEELADEDREDEASRVGA